MHDRFMSLTAGALLLITSCGRDPDPERVALLNRIDSLEQVVESLAVSQAPVGAPDAGPLEETPGEDGAGEGGSAGAGGPQETANSGTPGPEARAALERMQVRVDPVEHTSWYRDRSTPEFFDVPAYYFYIGQRPGSDPWLRWRLQINEGHWAFIESFVVVADGKSWTFRTTEFERDDGQTEWEWFDRNADPEDLAMARAVMQSTNALVRLKGKQFLKDREITAEQKAALRHVLQAYSALGG